MPRAKKPTVVVPRMEAPENLIGENEGPILSPPQDGGVPRHLTNRVKVSPIPHVKRTIPDVDKMPQVYTIPQSKGGIFYKVRSSNLIIFDEKRGENRQIRYCPNERSIFTDEQSNKAVVSAVVFRDKMLTVPFDQPNLREFLLRHPDNTANDGGAFTLLNKAVNQEEQLDAEFAVADAMAAIKSKTIDELIPIAIHLNIDTDAADVTIKHGLIRHAKRDPKGFLSLFSNPIVITRMTVVQAFDFNVITETDGVVRWQDTGKTILTCPIGQSAIDVVSRYCMTDRGRSLLDSLEQQLSEM